MTNKLKPATEEQTIELEFDFAKHFVTFGQIEDFNMAATSANFPEVRKTMAACITKWNLKGDPTDAAAYRDLTLHEFNAVQTLFLEELGKYFRT